MRLRKDIKEKGKGIRKTVHRRLQMKKMVSKSRLCEGSRNPEEL
jgi:hypothetical protein